MSADEFAHVVDQANAFFTDLKANNNRDWFNAHKKDYEATVKKPGQLLLDVIADDLRNLTGATPKTKMFRINRDVRFSKDKTPYNTHLHLLWAPTSDEETCNWFLGISPEYVTVGFGIMGFDKVPLVKFREFVDGPGGDKIATQTAALLKAGCRIDEPALKRVPSPFAKDHPRGDLLRRKGYVIWKDIEASAKADGLRKTVVNQFKAFEQLRETLDAAVS